MSSGVSSQGKEKGEGAKRSVKWLGSDRTLCVHVCTYRQFMVGGVGCYRRKKLEQHDNGETTDFPRLANEGHEIAAGVFKGEIKKQMGQNVRRAVFLFPELLVLF